MMNDIETSTRCSCGTPVSVGISNGTGPTQHGMWQAICYTCYDGTEDAGETAHVTGHGKTPEAALWEWQESHDDAWDVTWQPADLFGELARQVSEEAESARGWAKVPVEQCDPGWTSGPGCLVYCAVSR